jgi:transposase-like protein
MASHSYKHVSADRWRKHLLCRRYGAVHLSSVSFPTPEGGASSEPIVAWAIGFAEDYESEVLGAWAAGASSPWGSALDDLALRGVERIELAVVEPGAHLPEELQARFPRAVAVPSFGELLTRSISMVPARHREVVRAELATVLEATSDVEARSRLQAVEQGRWCSGYRELMSEWRSAVERGRRLWTLPPALRSELLSGDGTVAAVSQSLRRSVARHGPFSDQDSALAFVRQALDKSIRRIALRSDAAVTEHNHHRVGFSPRMAALGV